LIAVSPREWKLLESRALGATITKVSGALLP